MLITTRNSVYRIHQDGNEVVLQKVRTKRGKHTEISSGTTFREKSCPPVKIGGVAWVGGWQTSVILKIKREEGDENINFEAPAKPPRYQPLR